jgi:hypothetical protein
MIYYTSKTLSEDRNTVQVYTSNKSRRSTAKKTKQNKTKQNKKHSRHALNMFPLNASTSKSLTWGGHATDDKVCVEKMRQAILPCKNTPRVGLELVTSCHYADDVFLTTARSFANDMTQSLQWSVITHFASPNMLLAM